MQVELRADVDEAQEALAGTSQRHLTGRRSHKANRYLGHVLVAMVVLHEYNSWAVVAAAECVIASFFLCDLHQVCGLSLA